MPDSIFDFPSAPYNEVRAGHAGAQLRNKPGGICQRMARIEVPTARGNANRSSDATHNGRRAARQDRWSNNAAARTSSPRAIESSPSLSAPRRSGQKLSTETEREVIEFLKLFSAHYFRFRTQSQISEMTNAYRKYMCNINEKALSEGWGSGLFPRHPAFEQWWNGPKETEARLATNMQDEKNRLDRFLRAVNDCIEDKGIDNSNCYVISHTAYALDIERESKLSIPHPRKVKKSDTRQIASVITGFSCSGVRLSPYVIFKRPTDSHDSKHHSEKVRVSYNTSGWISDGNVFYDWLKRTFEPKTNPEAAIGEAAPARLLLLDGDKFEVSPSFFVECYSKNIFLFSFPRDSGKVFSSLEGAVSGFLDGEYSKYMLDKFHRNKSKPFKIATNKFTNLVHHTLDKSELDSVTKMAWIDACLVPYNPQGLLDRIRGDVNTPAPESWGSPQVRRSASRPPRPMQTPETSRHEQTPESDTDVPGDTSDVSDFEEWRGDGEEAASATDSADENEEHTPAADSSEDESSFSDEEEPGHEWKHPVDREEFLEFLRPLLKGKCDAKTKKLRDGLVAFHGEYQRVMQNLFAQVLSETPPRTSKRFLDQRTPKPSKRRKSG